MEDVFVEAFELGINELCSLIDNKKINVIELTQSAIDRIKQIENKINSFISFDEESVLKRALAVQEKLNKEEFKSPLAGIPMALKDNICTKDMKTTCGSKMLKDYLPLFDATAVSKLYESGAIVLGKTNLDEFAMGSTTLYSYFKKTANPWNNGRIKDVLCDGAAACVASGEVIYALGTDTGGAVRQSASLGGVVGLKPTYGLVSRYGLVECASSFDQIGPIARSVSDCALVLNIISGKDPMDSTSIEPKSKDYAGWLRKNTENNTQDIKDIRIGIPKELITNSCIDIDEDVRIRFFDAVDFFEKNTSCCEEFSFQAFNYALPVYCIISFAEISSSMGKYDGIKFGYRADGVKDLVDLYKRTRDEGFGAEVKKRIIIGTYVLCSKQYEKYYRKALKLRRLISDELRKVFERYDAIITPTIPVAATKYMNYQNDPKKEYECDILTSIANIAGLPAISIPCGKDSDGYPIGLQLIGNYFSEDVLFKIAHSFEQSVKFENNLLNT